MGLIDRREFKVGHLCCGSGFGALGFRKASARLGNLEGTFRNIGGIDIDPAGIRDFERFAGCKGTLMDLMSLEQYRAFHGKEPPLDWLEATTTDIHRAMGFERPNVWFISAPCKGFSGLLSEQASKHLKYQALNELTLRAVWLALEAFKDDPVEFFVFENVPRIANRGRPLLDQIQALFSSYGYAYAETTHDCGELGNLAQSRKRFLLLARHMEKVPPFLYEPPKRPLRAVGEILGQLPLPGDSAAGPMHRLPRLQWKTWVRLAFVEAGSDWRSLNKLNVEDGVLKDFGIVPERKWRDGALGVLDWKQFSGTVTASAEATTGRFNLADPRLPDAANWHNSALGVRKWDEPTGTVTGRGTATTGAFSLADPRLPEGARENQQYGVRQWSDTSGAIINVKSPGQGTFAVADPRPGKPSSELHGKFHVTPYGQPSRTVIAGRENGAYVVADPRTGYGTRSHSNKFHIVNWNGAAKTVTGAHQVQGGGLSVGDPRTGYSAQTHQNIFRVVPFDTPSGTVTSARHVTGGALNVADPRADGGFAGAGKYRVTEYGEPAGSVIGASTTGQGAFAVGDPRPKGLNRSDRSVYKTQGHHGVLRWDQTSGAVPAYAKHDRGFWSIADGRGPDASNADESFIELPAQDERLVARITAIDGTWHRPFTTLELAALQSLFDPEEWFNFEMDGTSDSAWRERIGNAVPPAASQVIGEVMARTLLLAAVGESFMLSADPIWVQPITIALSVDTSNQIQD